MYWVEMENIEKDGTFTKEEQSVVTQEWAIKKYNRTVNKWFAILCPHIHWDTFYDHLLSSINDISTDSADEHEIAVLVINDHLKFLNSLDNGKRKFFIGWGC